MNRRLRRPSPLRQGAGKPHERYLKRQASTLIALPLFRALENTGVDFGVFTLWPATHPTFPPHPRSKSLAHHG